MGVKLLDVPSGAGLAWIGTGFSLLAKRPVGLSAVFALFITVVAVLSLIPWLGALFVLAAAPLLTLGYLLAAHLTSQNQPLGIVVFVRAWACGSARERQRVVMLCVVYAALSFLAMWLADVLDGGSFGQQWDALAQAAQRAGTEGADAVPTTTVVDGFWFGLWLRALLMSALSVPFWFAPGLVFFAGQSIPLALFSSTITLWRARTAFASYAAGWASVLFAAATIGGVLVALLAATALVWPLLFAVSLTLTAAFYCSLYPSWCDCFGPLNPAPAVGAPPSVD